MSTPTTPHHTWRADAVVEHAVGTFRAIGNDAKPRPDALWEGRAGRGQGAVKLGELPCEVGMELALDQIVEHRSSILGLSVKGVAKGCILLSQYGPIAKLEQTE